MNATDADSTIVHTVYHFSRPGDKAQELYSFQLTVHQCPPIISV